MTRHRKKQLSRHRSLTRSLSSESKNRRIALKHKETHMEYSRSISNRHNFISSRNNGAASQHPKSSRNMKQPIRLKNYKPISRPISKNVSNRRYSYQNRKPLPRKPPSPEVWTHDRFKDAKVEVPAEKKKVVNLYAESFDQLYVEQSDNNSLP